MRVKNNKKTMATKLPIIFGAQKDIVKELRDAGCVLALMVDKPTFIPLEPRTLYNGIQNGVYTQKVSDDYVIKSSDITAIDTSIPEFTRAVIPQSKFPGMLTGADNFGTRVNMSGKFFPKNNLLNANYCYYFTTAANMAICFPPNTTLEQVRTELAGTIVRYQLTNPIDRLNAPLLRNPQPARTLPNGIKNEVSATNVSNDYVLTSADVVSVSLAVGGSTRCNMAMLPNMLNFGSNESQGTHITTSISEPLAGRSPGVLYTHNQYSSSNWAIYLPSTIQNTADARAFLTGVTVRYQLSVPITEPLPTLLVDQIGKIGKNLFDPVTKFSVDGTAVASIIDGGYAISGNPVGQLCQLIVPYELKPNTWHRLSAIVTNLTSPTRRISVRNSAYVGIGDLYSTGETWFKTDSTGKGVLYVQANTSTMTGATSVKYSNIQIEEVVVGPNEFNGYLYTENTGATFTRVSDSEFVLGVTSSLGRLTVPLTQGITFKPNTQYLISGKCVEVGNNNVRLIFVYTDGSTSELPSPTETETPFETFSISGKTIQLISYGYGTSGSITYKDLKIQEVPAGSSYEPYGKSNAQLVNVAWTKDDGYALLPIKLPTGEAIPYSNLIQNALLVDSNSDGLADGWLQSDTTARSCVNGIQSFTASAQFGIVINEVPNAVIGKRYYVETSVKCSVAGPATLLVKNPAVNLSPTSVIKTNNSIINVFDKMGGIFVAVASGLIKLSILDGRASAFTPIEFTKPNMMSLDDNPQILALENKLGRQLTANECEEFFAFTATNATVNVGIEDFFKADLLNTYGVLANKPNVDITGLTEFALGGIIKRPTGGIGYLIAKNADTNATIQYGIYLYSSGALEISVGDVDYIVLPAGGLLDNRMYKILMYRKDGRLKCLVNGVEVYNQPNTKSILSRPNLGILSRSSNADGTTRLNYSNVWFAFLSLFNGSVKAFTESQLIKVFNKKAKQYGL